MASSDGTVRKVCLVAMVGSYSLDEQHNALWMELEKGVVDKNEEALKRSLLGRGLVWGGEAFDQPLNPGFLRKQAQFSWYLTRNLHLPFFLEGLLILFEFEGVGESEKAPYSGVA